MTPRERETVRVELGTLKALLKSDPGNPALLKSCARIAIELCDYADALDMASAALLAAPGDSEALFHRASALIGYKQYGEAAHCLDLLKAQGRTEPGIGANRALCHYALGEFAAARSLLDELIAAEDPRPETLRLAVSSRHHLGDIDAAVELADAHPGAALQDGAAAGVYALAYLDAGRAADASRCAAEALAVIPDSIDGLCVQATVALSNMDTVSAQSQFSRVLELAPADGRAWIGLGTVALLAQDLLRAKELLERGVEAMPTHVGSWHVLGWTHLVAGDLEAAERVFLHALGLERNFAETHGALAAVHALRGRTAEARTEIAIADRLDRAGLAARFATAVLAGQAGNPVQARAVIRTTIAALVPRISARAARVLVASVRPSSKTRH